MTTKKPSCCYHKIIDKKRKGVRLINDFNLTIGFQSHTRWVDSKNPDQFMEFSLKRVDLQLDITNGVVDFEEGDKLGGSFQLNTTRKIYSSEKAEDKKTEPNIGTTASFTPSVKIDTGGDEHRDQSEYRTELESEIFSVQGNLSDSGSPFWTFEPVENYLSGNLTMVPLCTVRVKEKCDFSYSSRFIILPFDINITYMPSSWRNSLPFKGLRTQRTKLRIIDAISKSNNSLEN